MQVQAMLKSVYVVNGRLKEYCADELRFLGMIFGKTPVGNGWECDDKRQKMLMKERGLDNCNGVHTLMPAGEGGEKDILNEEGLGEMDIREALTHRRAVASLIHLALDRRDIVVASCVLARTMARPRVGGEVRLKRVLRYLKVHPGCALCFVHEPPGGFTVLSESDWAGGNNARKGSHLVSVASRPRHIVALSAGGDLIPMYLA